MPSLLHLHRETHTPDTTENPFICGLCNGYFKTYSRLVTHKLSHGINTESHILQISASLESSDSFIIPQYFCCKYCDKLYEQYTAYNIHMKHSKHFVPKEKVPTASLRERDVNIMRPVPTRRQQKESAMAGLIGVGMVATTTNGSDKRPYRHELDLAVENVTEELLGIPQPRSSLQTYPLAPNEKLICCKCGKNFATEKMLRVHENRHNPRRKRKAFTCNECDRFFGSKTELKKHENLYHRPYLACDHCGKEFRYRGWYLQHMQNRVCAKLDDETEEEEEEEEEEEMEETELEEPELDEPEMEDPEIEDDNEEEEESLLDDNNDFMPGSYSDILNRILLF